MEADDIDLIARIYDAAIDPGIWPNLLLRLARKLGAAGAFIFELQLDEDRPQITARTYSSNYIPEIVNQYVKTYNDQEIADQARFADLSREINSIELISDLELRPKVADLLTQPNTAYMMTHGLKHRAGALLNKDLVNIDRFALQYSSGHGPITGEEIKRSNLFLPHVAKVIGMSRPLENQLMANRIFEDVLRNIEQGIAILSPRGTVIYANEAFERCLAEHGVFRKNAFGVLQLMESAANNSHLKHYHDLVHDPAAHGKFGARARREALVVNLQKPGAALFIEICPVENSLRTGNLGAGCRLVTVIDTTQQVNFDSRRLQSFYRLSASETAVLELVAKGHSNQEIGEMRNRSQETIKTQLKALMRKTNSQSRTDLVHMIHNLSAAITYQSNA
jgi:DNA-binding CsgD family transcriptional regulator/PAS domain-containing protein